MNWLTIILLVIVGLLVLAIVGYNLAYEVQCWLCRRGYMTKIILWQARRKM